LILIMYLADTGSMRQILRRGQVSPHRQDLVRPEQEPPIRIGTALTRDVT
jgi:hypothetical protein